MLGTVFHYAVVEPEDDHSRCEGQVAGVIAMHERMGYRRGGAYNGHFCQHGGVWVSYTGPNQATGDTWANLNLHAWCYLATVGTPVTPAAAQAAYELTLFEPTGRDQIYPHSAFFATSCCGDPLREWIAQGALAPTSGSSTQEVRDVFIAWGQTVFGVPVAALIAGGRKVLDLSGPPGAYDIPQPALDWKAVGGRDAVPLVLCDPQSLGVLLSAPEPAGGAVGGLSAADVQGIVRAEIDATRLKSISG